MRKITFWCKQRYMNFQISIKMTIWYLGILILTLVLSLVVFYNLNYRFSVQKSADLSMQTLYSLKSNINNMIKNAEYNSLQILSNHEIQTDLKNSGTMDEFVLQRKISTSLMLLMYSMPSIDSVYVFDNGGHCYGTGRQPARSLRIADIGQAFWYRQVMALRGGCLLRAHANTIFSNGSQDGTVSLLRVINDTVSQRPIGILMMNISDSAFRNCYSEMVKKYGSKIVLLNEKGTSILNDSGLDENQIQEILSQKRDDSENPVILNRNEKRFIYSSMTLDPLNWKIVMGIPMEEIDRELSLYRTVSIVVILLNVLLLWGGTVVISRLITNPIHKLLESMSGVKHGQFNIVRLKTGQDEIGSLKDGYNLMIIEIQDLLRRTVNDQKIRRKLELSVLHEQIKPHFLYNTLDAMGYLALAGKNSELYDALEALGGYYRKSLSKGEEEIPIADEIEISKDYVLLQKLRFGDIFSTHFEINSDVLRYKTLKLVLQPLIENSIYHGIQPKGEHCDIWVRACLTEKYLSMTVEDNGIGMNKNDLKMIAGESLDRNAKGFGLRGTIQRLKLFYECEDVYSIQSEENKGTKVTLLIPKEKAERKSN